MADVGPVSTLTARTPLILSGDRLYIDDGAGGDFSVSLAVMAASVLASPVITGHATIEGVTATGATGTGKLVFDGTPTLVTPVLGVATATSINKVAITAPAASATLTIANTKTFTVSNTLTLTGTDGITVAFGGGLSIAAAKVVTVSNTLTLAGTDSTTMTFPTTSATIARTDAANTFTGVQTFSTPIAVGSVATMTATVGGGVPTPPNNTTTFLRGDGTFAAPAASGLTIGTTTITSGTTTRILYDNAGVVGEYTLTGSGTVVAMQTSPSLITPALGVATGTSLALGGATIGADALGVTGTTTFNGAVTHNAAGITLSGNISAAAWTTAGLRHKGAAFSATDTSSSGTVAAAYTNLFGVGTILASSATTYTNYFNTYFQDPVASTNVTMSNKWALGADSISIGTSNQFKVSTAGAITAGGTITGTNDITTSGLMQVGSAQYFRWLARSRMWSTVDSKIMLTNSAATDFGMLIFGGDGATPSASFPAIKRSTTIMQARLADDSAFGSFQGKLTTDTNATTGLTAGVLAATTNATVVIYDASGQAYRIPCII